jgi:hypothetical protein
MLFSENFKRQDLKKSSWTHKWLGLFGDPNTSFFVTASKVLVYIEISVLVIVEVGIIVVETKTERDKGERNGDD